VIPNRGPRDNLDLTRGAAIPMLYRDGGPGGLVIVKDLLQGRQALTFLAGASHLAGAALRGGLKQRRIQAQTGDGRDRLGQRSTPIQEGQGRVAAVSDQNERSFRQPASDLDHHLLCPACQRLVPPLVRLIVTLGRCQHGQKRQCPDPPCPGDRCQQHQTDPAQPAALDEETLAGAGGIAVDAFGRDLVTLSPLQGLVDADKHRPRRDKGTHEKVKHDPRCLPRGPLVSVEDAMVVLEAVGMGQPHHAQGIGDGSATGCEDCADEEHERMTKDGTGEQGSEVGKKGYNRGGQGRQDVPLLVGSYVSLPCSLTPFLPYSRCSRPAAAKWIKSS